MRAYTFLKETFARMLTLEQRMARITWRQVSGRRTLLKRSRSSASLGGEISALLRAPATADAMSRCRDGFDGLSPEEQRNYLFWYSRWWRVSRMPRRLVEELSAACEESKTAWSEAVQQNDYAAVLPAFRRVVALTQEKADLWKEGDMTRYDALLDVYDPGQRASALFERYRWLEDGTWKDDSQDEEETGGHFTRASWRAETEEIARLCGFDLERGRIDFGKHSMTLTVGRNDVRLLLAEKFGPAARNQLFHEIGHGVLEQALKRNPLWSWRANAPSQAFHENTAKLYERHGPDMAEGYHVRNHEEPCDASGHCTRKDLTDKSGGVRSLLRLNSSGRWYALHIWLRFKMERAIINGSFYVDNLALRWEEETRMHLAASPSTLREGCLQDIQWYMGLFGYFPLYFAGSKQELEVKNHTPENAFCARSKSQKDFFASLTRLVDAGWQRIFEGSRARNGI